MSDPIAALDQAEAALFERLPPEWRDAYRRNPDRVLEFIAEQLEGRLEEEAERLNGLREWLDIRVHELRRKSRIDDDA